MEWREVLTQSAEHYSLSNNVLTCKFPAVIGEHYCYDLRRSKVLRALRHKSCLRSANDRFWQFDLVYGVAFGLL